MQILDVVRSVEDLTTKLVFSDEGVVYEVSALNKGDGKDILVVPTQTSCKLGCQFCHLTGLNILVKNNSREKLVEMVRLSVEHLKLQESSNKTLLISYMGAGEPLMNVEEMVASAEIIAKTGTHEVIRFGVATLIPGEKPFREFTRRVKESGLNFKLHWSLHSVDEMERRVLMPAALGLTKSAELVNNYVRETGRAAEIHYTLMANVNDRPQDVAYLSEMVKDKSINIKLLRFSPREEVDLRESERVATFRAMLKLEGFSSEVYSPPGRDIGSSCGQFRLDDYYDQIGKPSPKSLPIVA
jgi:23S rRNA (adenine2503-C2)-methyltransferase